MPHLTTRWYYWQIVATENLFLMLTAPCRSSCQMKSVMRDGSGRSFRLLSVGASDRRKGAELLTDFVAHAAKDQEPVCFSARRRCRIFETPVKPRGVPRKDG